MTQTVQFFLQLFQSILGLASGFGFGLGEFLGRPGAFLSLTPGFGFGLSLFLGPALGFERKPGFVGLGVAVACLDIEDRRIGPPGRADG